MRGRLKGSMGASYQYATLPCSNNFLDTLTLTFFVAAVTIK
jgi:hypothetical protein